MKRIFQFSQQANSPYAFTFLSWLLITLAMLCYNKGEAKTGAAFSCHNVTNGGIIGNYEVNCGAFDPGMISNEASPSGGSGALEYMWLQTTDPSLPWEDWNEISGANGPSYDPGMISQTTYFLRCSRRENCSYWDGESNIVAKIVAHVDTNCGGQLTTRSGNIKRVLHDNGVSYEENLIGAPDGHVAKFYDENDNIVVELDDVLKAGDQFIVSWKTRDYYSSFGGPARLQLFVSENGTDFQALTNLETNSKIILINDYVTVNQNVKFIKLLNGWGRPDFSVDAISYCLSDCQIVCDNVTDGGQIEGTESNCGAFASNTIGSLSLPSGGSGDIEYLWLGTTDFNLPATQWDTLLAGPAAGPTFNPGFITQTTYYLRCSRRKNCELYLGESNIISKVVIDNSNFICDLGSPSGFTPGNAESIFENDGVDGANNTLNAIDGQLAQLFDDQDFIIVDLGETLLAGETYVISWKGNLMDLSPKPIQLNILESSDGVDFTVNTTAEIAVKDFVVSQNFSASRDLRYLKIEKPVGSGFAEIDAISYCKAQCPVCESKALVVWDLDDCSAISGSTNIDFSEFTPAFPNAADCNTVTASNVFREHPTTNSHSCTPGFDGHPAMCVSSRSSCSFNDDDAKAVRFEVTLSPDASGKAVLTGLEFYQKAPLQYDWINGASGQNNPPSKYGLRVTIDGQEVFKQIDNPASNDWTLESFDFSNDPDFTVTQTTTFAFELLGYCTTGSGSIKAWDLDQIQVLGCCTVAPPVCDNITDGGHIDGGEVNCGSFDPGIIGSVSLPSGGSGNIEYLWLGTTDFNLRATQWDTLLAGPAAGPTFDPGPITQTTYYLRCSRRENCELFVGESNIIAKVVVDNSNFDCAQGSPLGFNAGNANTIFENNGVANADNALNVIDGAVAELYDDQDFIIVDLGETLLAGETYVISWKGSLLDLSSNPVQLNILESGDGVDFTANTTAEIAVKDFVVSQNFSASRDLRYLKIEKPIGSGFAEIDAISYCKAECLVCDNLTDGGQITGTESNCGSFDPGIIGSVSLPSGGSGAIEYLWLGTTNFNLPATQWDTLLVGPSAGPSFDPGPITQTTYYLRCSRRENCELYVGESNIIAKVVVDNSNFNCELGSPLGFNPGNANTIFENNGAANADNALNAIDGAVAELYDDQDFIIVDLGETLLAGETYVISWKGSLLDLSPNPVQLNILESGDGVDFTANTTAEIAVKDFVVSQNFSASRDLRYLKIEKPVGSGFAEIDAISYCKAECPVCDNLTDGGQITGTESNCGSFDPGIIGSVSLPSGGSGIIEYLWLGTTDASLPATQWDTLLVGPSAGPTFDPGLITQTTYYLRCSRREFCELYVGESNIISKVVIDATLPCPSGAAAPCVLGNAVEVVEDDGVFTSRRIVGPINGSLAELYEDTDFVILDLGTTLRPGETYVISWKGTLLDTTANPAKIEISESMNTVDFTAVGSLETRVKDFVISQSRTATVPTRFLRIDKADGLGLVEIDAISYAQLDCPPCDNLTDGGKITGTESNCDSFDPSTINSISLPSGGSGNIEYLWLGTTDASLPATQWDTLLVGPSAGPTFDPGPITQTTYYLRCSRRENCELFVGESNIIAKVVVDASLPCAGGIKTPCVLGNAVEVVEDKGVFTGHRTVGPINGSLAELYEDTDYIVLDLGVTLQAGETYVISWKGTLLDISADPAKIEISEAVDTANFTAVGSLETFVKDFVVSQSVRASGPVRFLRIDKADGFGLVEIDAVTYGQSSCTLPTICELNDHGKADRFNADRTVWLRFAANDEIREYTVAGSGAKLTEFPNGTALLTGIAADVEIPCNQWLFSVKLINKRDWMSWSALGRSYKANNRIANDNHEDWFYYELDDNNSTFTGLDCNEGRVLNLTHMPSDFEFGFQVGDGANLKNENYGISGWFEFTGDFSGRGDFNGNLDNCVEQETAVHIGDFVWEDLNGNGQQDSDEPGIESVKVQLIGTDFCGNGVNMTQFTDANGSYLFSNLTPGTYKTIFSQLPGAYFTTKEKEGTDPSIDSDVNPISGMSDLRVYGGGEKDTTLDAGYIRFASVGDFVWEDLNGDGIKDFNEPGIPNVTVELSGEDGTGEMVSQIKQTNAQGLYYFDGLRPGTYKLSFSPGGTFQATTKGAGTDDTVDSDINPDGMTDLFTLISHETNSNLDAGYYRLLNISGRVFDDRNDDGLQDAGDLDVADVIIALLRKNAGGTFDPVDNFSTLENGRFAFNGLVPGEYQVRADESSLPIDFIFSKNQDVNGNANDAIDNDADDTGVIENIVLRSGQPDLTTLGIGILFNIILPVELVDFQAKLVNNNQALLTWITESEIDNKHFVIERSIDGQLFETIGVVAGNGTSNHINTYFYKDETPFFGRNYYRLKQVDFDGDYEFSDIRTVVVKGNDLPDAIFYPNPTKDFTTLRVVTPFESQATVEIVNAHGQILRTLIVPQGSNSLDIDMSDLQPGFYFMQVKYNEFRKIIHRVLKIQD